VEVLGRRPRFAGAAAHAIGQALATAPPPDLLGRLSLLNNFNQNKKHLLFF
jgi:hypothetical protein